jgi:DNA replication protein DnaC
MNPVPELTPLLKKLRLSGLLDTLEQRNREAVERKLAYTEFLTLLIQDEVARRDQRKFDLRLRRAGFRSSKTIEAFDFDFNPKVPRELILDLATCRFLDERVSVLIAGPCGTGKSHLAQALGHSAVRHGYDVLFLTQSQLLGNLHKARAMGTYERRFQALVRVDLLIIDDYGLKPLRSPQDEDLHDLIAERYERVSTLVTSNLDFSEWGEAFPNRLLGASTLDRLRDSAYRVILEGESHRKPKPLPPPPKAKAGRQKNSVKGGGS